MDAQMYIAMIHDRHFFDYKKMEYKYSSGMVAEMLQLLLSKGNVTEKEKELFHFVLSSYGTGEFSTKQLEKDFRNCAYATIRSFVLKMTAEGILECHSYGNRNKYCIASASDLAEDMQE